MTTRSWFRKLFARKPRTSRKHKPRKRLCLEALENRILLATQVFNVTTTVDEVSANGQLSLREAIMQANAVPLSDDVVINLQPSQRYAIGADRDRFQFLLVPSDTELHFRDAEYGDFDIRRAMNINGNGSIVDADAKAEALREWADAEGIPLAATVAIGDGANDLKMMEVAALSVAFNAKPIVRERADVSIEFDLGLVIPLLDRLG